MKKKVVFNYLPPAMKEIPSPAFSIFKTFLKHNNFESDIIYWNLILDCRMEKEKALAAKKHLKTQDIITLFPYLYIFADEYKDHEAANKIINYLGGLNPVNLIAQDLLNPIDFIDKYLIDIKNFTLDKINKKLDKIDFSKVLYWAFSATYYQWIPGYILAKEIKKRDPGALIVIGGFGNQDKAYEIMKSFNLFDYAIYEEGEYPLLDLCHYIEKGKPDLKNIPRLIYRDKKELKISETSISKYLDFDEFNMPDYSDYSKYIENISKDGYQLSTAEIHYPVNTIRSCWWRSCKFCNSGLNFKYSEKKPEMVVKEIEILYEKYDVKNIYFTDNDTLGKDIKRFEHLLEILIESNKRHNMKYSFITEIIVHKELSSEIFKKMKLAGFKILYGGIESTSDSMLKKLNKLNRFAHNVIFIKFCIKFRIINTMNILSGIPGETDLDVKECVKNLHFLRFFFHNDFTRFPDYTIPIQIYKESNYNSSLSESGKKEYSPEQIYDFLPAGIIDNPFNIFGYTSNKSLNKNEWDVFKQVLNYFFEHEFSYKIIKNKNNYYYFEYLDKKLFTSLVFEELYFEVLSMANNQVISLDDMHKSLIKNHDSISKEEIKKILTDLKKQYLLYYNEDCSNIASVIDMDIIS